MAPTRPRQGKRGRKIKVSVHTLVTLTPVILSDIVTRVHKGLATILGDLSQH